MIKDAVWVLIIVVASLGCFQFALQLWDLSPRLVITTTHRQAAAPAVLARGYL